MPFSKDIDRFIHICTDAHMCIHVCVRVYRFMCLCVCICGVARMCVLLDVCVCPCQHALSVAAYMWQCAEFQRPE